MVHDREDRVNRFADGEAYREDRVNRFADGEAYRDAVAGAELIATQGFGHRRMLKEPFVTRAVAAFVAKT
ncbi:MAG: hypothetical protein WKG52_03765 [Variovorax sp.]